MSEPEILQRFPAVTMAMIECPFGCGEAVPIEGSVVIGVGMEGGMPVYRFGSALDSSSIEMHLVEHGIMPEVHR